MAKDKHKISVILEMYDQAYNQTAWHGTNLRGSVKGLKLPELLWHPQPKRHNIWETTVHCAYWKYIALRRLTDGKKGDFPRKPSNWAKLPAEPTIKLWKEDLALLDSYHQELRVAIEKFPENKLSKTPADSKLVYKDLLYGIASHDLYHAGQIQLLKRMYRNRNK